jgi:hypothetical protein
VEGPAAAGGISISGTVYEHIKKDKLALGYHYLGEQDVKNIPEPIRVYRLITESEAAGKAIGRRVSSGTKKIKMPTLAATIISIIVCGVVAWYLYTINSNMVEAASVGAIAYPLPENPSIVVLRFYNLSDEPDKSYLSDG